MDKLRKAYEDGRAARVELQDKDTCPIGSTQGALRHWWLAGWHDQDMEMSRD